jgi:hypothetical protein
MEERILTQHPKGKKGVRISKAKYETMKQAILQVLGNGRLTHDELTAAVEAYLKHRFEGSVGWYLESTKLDLEARGVIERVPGGKYEVYRRKR